jgi:hypothetical protein
MYAKLTILTPWDLLGACSLSPANQTLIWNPPLTENALIALPVPPLAPESTYRAKTIAPQSRRTYRTRTHRTRSKGGKSKGKDRDRDKDRDKDKKKKKSIPKAIFRISEFQLPVNFRNVSLDM